MSNTNIDDTQLLALDVIESAGVAPDTVAMLKKNFLPFLKQARAWRERAEGLVVTSEDQAREMKMAREARLALRQIRIDADKTRKELKADALAYGRAVQAVYNTIERAIKPTEEHLLQQEKFAEIQKQKRLEALNAKRSSLSGPWLEWIDIDLPFNNTPWAHFSEEEFAAIIADAKAAKGQHEKEEAERRAREEAERLEAERIRKENERLKKEAEEREREAAEERRMIEEAARKEREEAEAKLAAERAERERLEAEARQRVEAERKRKEEEEAARIKAEQAPDKEKLMAFASELQAINLPEVKSERAVKARAVTEKKIMDAAIDLLNMASKL